MKQVNSLKFWHGLLFMLMMVSKSGKTRRAA